MELGRRCGRLKGIEGTVHTLGRGSWRRLKGSWCYVWNIACCCILRRRSKKQVISSLCDRQTILSHNSFVVAAKQRMIMTRLILVSTLILLWTKEVTAAPLLCSYAILSMGGVTNTGTLDVTGDVGVSPITSSAITGLALIMDESKEFSASTMVEGKVMAADYSSGTTKEDLATDIAAMIVLRTEMSSMPYTTKLTGTSFSGLVLTPGVYKYIGAITMAASTKVTLTGGPDDIFVFQSTGALTLGASAVIELDGGVQAKNVFWTPTAATFGANAKFQGVLLTSAAANYGAGAEHFGHVYAQTHVTTGAGVIIKASRCSDLPLSHVPSTSPTMFAAPSVATTAAPFSLLGKTDWDIDRIGEITVDFSEVATEEEIKITFSIHRRDATVRVFQEDCRTAVDESVIGLVTTRAPSTGTHDTLEVFLDIKQDSVSESPIFSEIDTGTGKISICVRVDLLSASNMSSVVFYDQQLFVTVDMTADFAVQDIDLFRGFDSVDVGASFDYTVTACQCNESFECEPQILTQASDALICIETSFMNVEIASIRQLVFNQGSLSQNAVSDGAEDELTIVNVGGKMAVVRTKLTSSFFELDFPENIEVAGVCTLKFVDDNGQARRLNARVNTDRTLQQTGGDQPEEVGFAVELLLEAGAESSGADKIAASLSSMMTAMVYGAAMLM